MREFLIAYFCVSVLRVIVRFLNLSLVTYPRTVVLKQWDDALHLVVATIISIFVGLNLWGQP